MTHHGMSLRQRVENSMTGFLLLDLWRVVADRLERQRGVQKGSLYLANQTRVSLQNVCLNLIVVAMSKDDVGDPFKYGHLRLTEAAVEEHFGMVRSQSASAQHSARSFWKASPKHMLARSRTKEALKPPKEILKALSAEEFDRASQRAYKASLKLVAYCSGFAEDSLKSTYEGLCSGTVLNAEPEPLHPFEDDDNGNVHTEMAPGSEVGNIVSSAIDEAKFDAMGTDQLDGPETEGETAPPEPDMLDADDLTAVLDADPDDMEGGEPVTEAAEDPETLFEAVSHLQTGSCKVEVWDRLWRLTMFVRYWFLGSCLTGGSSRETPIL